MTQLRSIQQHASAQKVNMGGIILDQALPLSGLEQIDPFLLIHHWNDTLKGDKHPSEVGVGPHPHRGFAPVTFIFEGGVHHRDSIGNSETVHAGGVQWMHSGKGIVHSERPTKLLAKEGGKFEIIQFWVNVPSEYKMIDPYYVPLHKEATPTVVSSDGKVTTSVICGTVLGSKGNIETQSPLQIARIDLKAGGSLELPIELDHNALIYQLDGKTTVNDTAAGSAKDMFWFANDGEAIKIQAKEDTRLILLAGKPIGEPLATYGPFVMNTQAEIMTALQDYQTGKMGALNENFE